MESTTQAAPVSKMMLWTGRVISALPVLMLLISGVMKIILGLALSGTLSQVKPEPLAKGFEDLGWPASIALHLGIVELGCAVVYAIPRTAVLGAILITGYLGGAIATHVRISESFVIPLILGVLVWLGLYLRDTRIRDLIPLSRI